MTRKKRYIIPQVGFEEMEPTTGFCDEFTASAPNIPVIDEDRPQRVKATDFCLDDAFEGPIEAANKSFEYSIEFDY